MAAAPTTTSYAILGLLAIKPWTTYELAQQMDRALGRFWPRSESKLYEEPKKLVAHGLARAAEERVGRRGRTVYSITPRGRRALARWQAEPGDGPVLEFEQLLKVFFSVAHDPTEKNRQGPDVGTQYRSAIFYTSDEQKKAATDYIAAIENAKVFPKPVVTEVSALDNFYDAEDYHQNYLAQNPSDPYIVYNDLPKLEALKKKFPDLYVKK